MRIVIIIQTIIILLGAYYYYTQSQEEKVVPEVIVPTLQPATSTDNYSGYVPPTENPPGYEAEIPTPASTTVSGASDSGMEYPTMDSSLPEVQ